MSKQSKMQEEAIQEPRTRNVSIAEILRKGNLSISDPGPVTPPTATISTRAPGPSGKSRGALAQEDGKK